MYLVSFLLFSDVNSYNHSYQRVWEHVRNKETIRAMTDHLQWAIGQHLSLMESQELSQNNNEGCYPQGPCFKENPKQSGSFHAQQPGTMPDPKNIFGGLGFAFHGHFRLSEDAYQPPTA